MNKENKTEIINTTLDNVIEVVKSKIDTVSDDGRGPAYNNAMRDVIRSVEGMKS